MVTSYGQGQYSGSAAASEAHQWAVPYGYKADGTKRLVVWCHSAGGLAAEPFASAASLLLVEALVSTLGLPAISFDASPPASGLAQHWGNDTAQARMTDAVAFAASKLNAKTDRVLVVGVSMGAMLALNWACANPSKIAALALLYPATSLQAIHDASGGAGSGAATTEAAYGGSLGAFNAAVAAHDPSQHASAIAALGVPMKMWYSTADTTVGTANQTAFATAVGAPLVTESLGAVAHADMSQVAALDLQRFVAAAM